jgi:hypothetical protein
MTYLMRNVIAVTRGTIQYLDNENNEQEINLFECGKNWVNSFNNRDNSIPREGIPAPEITVENNTCVGVRDWFAEKPYIELFSIPKIRFEICPEKGFFGFLNRNKKYKEFHKLCADLQKVGWTTFDLG